MAAIRSRVLTNFVVVACGLLLLQRWSEHFVNDERTQS